MSLLLAACTGSALPESKERCAQDCAWRPSPPACTAPTRPLYLAPNGNDANDGRDPARARLTLNGVRLAQGDQLRLAPGEYATGFDLRGSGSAECPLVFSGSSDFSTVLTRTLRIAGSHWRITQLKIQAEQGDRGIGMVPMAGMEVENVVIERVRFGATGKGYTPPPSDPFVSDIQLDHCKSCIILRCEFEGSTSSAMLIEANASDVVIRGNVIRSDRYVGYSAVMIGGRNALFEGNEITGRSGKIVHFYTGTSYDGRIIRNVFHDVAGTAVLEAGEVRSNTFVGMPMGTAVEARMNGNTIFHNNLVSNVRRGTVGVSDKNSGYNLFDQVPEPYVGKTVMAPTDRVGLALLGPDFLPLQGSAALDAADPLQPVPPGGGGRADIGALEKGGCHLPDGTYCLP